MEINLFTWFLAAGPIILFLVVMLGFKWGGSRAGAMSWLATVLVALIFFGANFELIAYTYSKAFFLSLDVLLIIWTALFLFILTEQAGTITKIGNWLTDLTTDKAMQGIFLGWLFPSFLQGMGGFGVPVAVAAPLLVSTGFNPIQALVMSSVGHAWGVTFGSMASSYQSMLAVTNLPGELLAPATSALLGILAFISGLLVTFVADGFKGLKRAFFTTTLISAILAGGQYLLSSSGLWIIAVTVPALVALIINYLIIAVRRSPKTPSRISQKDLLLSLLPYVILVTLTLVFNLVGWFKATLGQVKFELIFPEIATSLGDVTPAGPGRAIRLLTHPGSIIFLSAMITYLVFNAAGILKKNDLSVIFKRTVKSSINTTIAIFTMVGIATIMSHTQMTEVLASGISRAFGRSVFPLVSPFIGALGAFITGSNSNSNVLFAALQMRTAELLGLSVPLILAAQTAGGAMGSMMAPAKVILGCATVGLINKEGEVIGKILIYGVGLILFTGVLVMVINGYGIF
jgi:lactate permease